MRHKIILPLFPSAARLPTFQLSLVLHLSSDICIQALLTLFLVYTWGSLLPHSFPETKNSHFLFRVKPQVNSKFGAHNPWMKWHIASWSPLLAVFCRTASYLAIEWAYICFELLASFGEQLWLSHDSVMPCILIRYSLIWKKTQVSHQQSARLWMHPRRWRQYYNHSVHAGLWYVP